MRCFIIGKSRVSLRSTHKCQFSVDLKVAGTLRVPSATHSLGIYIYGTRRVPTTLHIDLKELRHV